MHRVSSRGDRGSDEHMIVGGDTIVRAMGVEKTEVSLFGLYRDKLEWHVRTLPAHCADCRDEPAPVARAQLEHREARARFQHRLEYGDPFEHFVVDCRIEVPARRAGRETKGRIRFLPEKINT